MTAATDAWWDLGTDYQSRQTAVRAVRCPRCHAEPGQQCTTPNGWAALHKARINAAAGRQPAKRGTFRLSDAQAERLEWAAEAGVFYAPDQYAAHAGDAARRAVADALVRAGLVEETGPQQCGERALRLTAEGWRVWCTHRLVIRRFPEGQHPEACWCRRDDKETNR